MLYFCTRFSGDDSEGWLVEVLAELSEGDYGGSCDYIIIEADNDEEASVKASAEWGKE